jgi:hypothetical protein
MTTITRERLLEIIEDGFLKHGESKELARIALSSLEVKPIVTNYWMPAVGEYCEVKSEQFADHDWVKIKVVAVHNGRVAAIVCQNGVLDYDQICVLGWEYDQSIFRPLPGINVESSPISAEDTLR